MRPPRYLHHVTLTTGDVRRSPREEVSPEALADAQQLLVYVLQLDAPPRVIMPALGDYTLTARASGRCLLGLVRAPQEIDPLATIGIAAHSRCGAWLWRDLHGGQTPVVTDRERCPPEPWVASALHPRAAAHPGAMLWLGDFERCLGWAWLARLEVH